jgi:predicted membrane channel-forming protein YqfA (hemolysin III family)
LLYVAVFLGYGVIYFLTEPDAAYLPNVTFQKLVAVGLGVFLVRAVVTLCRQFDLGQACKVIFWVGALVYTLGDIVYLFRGVNQFHHFPEFLVGCYILGVILKERSAEPAKDCPSRPASPARSS